MRNIYACDFVDPIYPPIEPIEAPLPFENVETFEDWLREVYIPRTLPIRCVPLTNTGWDIDANKTECWAVFSADGIFERSCQVYARTPLTPQFQEYLRGKIFVHNHFSDDSTLSTGEVVAWADLQMGEFTAVTPTRSYSIRPKNRKWPNPHLLKEFFLKHPELNDGTIRNHCYQLLAHKGIFEYNVTTVDNGGL
jgi:hypothetical protein